MILISDASPNFQDEHGAPFPYKDCVLPMIPQMLLILPIPIEVGRKMRIGRRQPLQAAPVQDNTKQKTGAKHLFEFLFRF